MFIETRGTKKVDAGETARGMSRSTASRLRRSVGHTGPTEGPEQGPKPFSHSERTIIEIEITRRAPP